MEHPMGETSVEKMLIKRAALNQHPINGSFELLPLCNMSCDMCYVRLSHKEMEQKGRLHTADEWIELARQLKDAGVLFLLLTGGEPLLFPDFRKLYVELQKMGMILTINTNGTLIDEDWANFFEKHKPRRINITLYGIDETAYETLCHYPEGYSKTIYGIKLLKQRKVDVKINGSVTKNNMHDMEFIYKLGRQLDIPVHMDTYMLPGLRERKKPYEKQSRLDPKQAANAEIQTLKAEFPSDFFRKYVENAIRSVQNHTIYTQHISCLAGNCSFTVNWQGEMRPCVTLPEPTVPVFEVGFDAAWKEISRKSKELRSNERCTTCSFRPICKTCVASALLETGHYDGVPDYLCQYAEEYYRLLCKEWES